jgi:hypothetical protein
MAGRIDAALKALCDAAARFVKSRAPVFRSLQSRFTAGCILLGLLILSVAGISLELKAKIQQFLGEVEAA